MRIRVERNVRAVKGESIVRIAISKSKWKKEARQHKSEGKCCSLLQLFSNGRMETKSITLAFIQRPFEGRFNSKTLP